MEVIVIFDPAFQGDAGGAVWIVGTPENKKWFDALLEHDPNSAVFSADGYQTVDDCVAHMIWNVQEHHPSWEQIRVVGAALTPAISTALKDEGDIVPTSDGFLLRRGRPDRRLARDALSLFARRKVSDAAKFGVGRQGEVAGRADANSIAQVKTFAPPCRPLIFRYIFVAKVVVRKGRARARAQGVHMGRKPKLTTFQRHEALARVANGETTRDVARSYNVSHSTISRIPA